jgi:hypothetical protein
MSALKVVALDPKTLIYLFDLAVAASLVCGLGLLASRVCRSRPAPVRHGVLVGALALVLLSPGAVWLAQHSGLTWMQLSVSEQAESGSFLERVGTERLPGPVHVERKPSVSSGIEQLPAMEPLRIPSRENDDSSPGMAALATETPSQPAPDEGPSPIPPISVQPREACSWQVLGAILALSWTAGILVQLVHLAGGYWLLVSFRRCLKEVVEPRVRSVAQQAAEAMGRHKAPRIFSSPLAPAPLCLGFLKPIVVESVALSISERATQTGDPPGGPWGRRSQTLQRGRRSAER